MFTKSKLITIFTALSVLLLIHGFETNAFGVCGACVANTITCTGSIANTDPSTAGGSRPAFGDPQSTCAVPTTCTTSTNTFFYDAYTFTNNTGGATPDCFTVTLTNTSCGINLGSAAFLGTFNPASTCTNYLADDGTTVASGAGAKSYSFNVANGGVVTVIVTTNTTGLVCGAGGTYTFAISPCPNSAPTAGDSSITGRIPDSNGNGLEGVIVFLTGSQTRKTITDAGGNYFFDNVETNGFYNVLPSRANYSFNPGSRSFSQLGNTTEALFNGSLNYSGANPIDTPEYFVRQHYVDFLGREPDESGFNYWSNQILGCAGDAACIDRKNVNVSAAYFYSIEFQSTGGLVDALYRASFGRRPHYAEFAPDTSAVAKGVVVGKAGWQQQLGTNKQAFLDAWVQRPAFRSAYDLLTNDRYVDTLIGNTGVAYTAAERDSLVMDLSLGTLSRTDVLQRIAEDQRFADLKRNDAFVMMEYFGYLRRDPDAVGFQYWLDKLNQFNGNFEKAEMVRSFLVSDEFRHRFPQ